MKLLYIAAIVLSSVLVMSQDIHQNAGGGADTVIVEKVFEPDQDYNASIGHGFIGGKFHKLNKTLTIQNPELWQTVRYGEQFEFRADLPNGSYEVTFYAWEYYFTKVGQRIFTMDIEGSRHFYQTPEGSKDEIDLYQIGLSVPGEYKTITATMNVLVLDNQLNIVFNAVKDNAIIQGISVRQIVQTEENTPTVNNIKNLSCESVFPGQVLLNWENGDEYDSIEININGELTETLNGSTDTFVENQLPEGARTYSLIAKKGDVVLETVNCNVLVMPQPEVVLEPEPPTDPVEPPVEPPVFDAGNALVFTRMNQDVGLDVIARDRDYMEAESHGNIWILSPISPEGQLTNLTGLQEGNGAVAFHPHVSPDAEWIYFSMRESWNDNYSIYKMRPDGSDKSQLTTHQWADDINPVVCGNKLAFLSNRLGIFDEYGKRVAVTLYVSELDGSNPRPIMQNLSGEYDLYAGDDGYLYFSRWDYRPLVGRIAEDNYTIWRCAPDGSGLKSYFGFYDVKPRPSNKSWQDTKWYSRSPDGSTGLFTGVARWYTSHNFGAGWLATFPEPQGNGWQQNSITRITPQVPLETGSSNSGRYREAIWLDNSTIIAMYSNGPVAYGRTPIPTWKLVTLSKDGNNQQDLLSLGEDHIAHPRVLRQRPVAPIVTHSGESNSDLMTYACDDVYNMDISKVRFGGSNMIPFDRDDPEYRPVAVRIVQGDIAQFESETSTFYDFKPKDPTFLGDIKAQISIRFLGEVPIHEDGSWAAQVPVNVPVTFQVLNYKGKVINQMPIWLAGTAGEVQRCSGCHSDVTRPTPLKETTIALELDIPRLDTRYDLDFGNDIAPFLDQKCSSCHSGENPVGVIDLSNDKTLYHTMSYRSLTQFQRGRFGLPEWQPFKYGANFYSAMGGVDSFLLSLMDGDIREGTWRKASIPYGARGQETDRLAELINTHAGLLSQEEFKKLAQWTSFPSLLGTTFYRHEKIQDNNIYPRPDNTLWPAVEAALKNKCSSCHNGNPTAVTLPEFTTKTSGSKLFINKDKRNGFYNRVGINSNFDNPEQSPILRLPLGNTNGYKGNHPQVWTTSDPEYQLLLQWIQNAN